MRLINFSHRSKMHHLCKLICKSVSYNRDYPIGTRLNQWQCDTIVSREHLKSSRSTRYNFIYLFYISRCLLYTYYITAIRGQSQGRIWKHIHTCTSWHIVQDDGKLRSICDCLEMCIHTLLRRFIIIGHYRQYRIHSLHGVIFQCIDNMLCTIAATTQQDWQATGITFDYSLTHLQLLFCS